MTIAGLKFLNDELSGLNIPYEFMEWTSKLPTTYFVGQYSEVSNPDEDGMIESDFIITGTTKNKYLDLENVNQMIREHFPSEGLTEILPNGWGIAVMYETSYPIPAIEQGIKRIQITLKVKEWKGE